MISKLEAKPLSLLNKICECVNIKNIKKAPPLIHNAGAQLSSMKILIFRKYEKPAFSLEW